ncbi:glycoside hydrolase family 3 N-terminal domain-containing protein [Paenibacillus sp. D2_2]|uniref:glycoside hydrolase family 3 protein n=1 Tax=Paenibacillus sp. D2_2 TaxID=3073092 RepID=UPI002814EC78|nr:glycoside hydrolase family 3 N-terminal domain-containing protein [Paenibacillus sp. D2_2]WMT41320.1 glycoside hydrolase family 3 N-terminal domain-containing protein [Paenibacillus sp. D2_2]
MINTDILMEKPFYLSEGQRKKVTNQIEQMSLQDKVGQLFFLAYYGQFMSDENVLQMVRNIQPGGMMLRPTPQAKAAEIIDLIQANSRIAPFISANLENGVNGLVEGGVSYGSLMQLSATNDPQLVNLAASDIGKQSRALGANMAFAPVVDLNYHCLNPITGTRAFGEDAEHVKDMALSFCKGFMDNGIQPVIKHFPGDGVDDRDQHVLASVNSLPFEQWEESYGAVYKELIDQGVPCVMAGHILLPAFERMVQPGINDQELLPATLSRHLLKGLLRDRLGFNGLIITDASGMCGFTSFATRQETMVNAINAGCDMLLFTKDLEEDYSAVLQAVMRGVISNDRLNEALVRILGMKESINTKMVAEIELSPSVHLVERVFDQSITLVKDNDRILPINTETYHKILLISLGNEDKSGDILAKELEMKGFQVTVFDTKKMDLSLIFGKVADLRANYDLVIYACDYQVKSNQTSNRIEWGMPAGQYMPWFVKELPVIMISFGNPYHLYDAPRIPTYINAYSNADKNIEMVVKKLVGESEFKGVSPVDAFCGMFDTRC